MRGEACTLEHTVPERLLVELPYRILVSGGGGRDLMGQVAQQIAVLAQCSEVLGAVFGKLRTLAQRVGQVTLQAAPHEQVGN